MNFVIRGDSINKCPWVRRLGELFILLRQIEGAWYFWKWNNVSLLRWIIVVFNLIEIYFNDLLLICLLMCELDWILWQYVMSWRKKIILYKKSLVESDFGAKRFGLIWKNIQIRFFIQLVSWETVFLRNVSQVQPIKDLCLLTVFLMPTYSILNAYLL